MLRRRLSCETAEGLSTALRLTTLSFREYRRGLPELCQTGEAAYAKPSDCRRTGRIEGRGFAVAATDNNAIGASVIDRACGIAEKGELVPEDRRGEGERLGTYTLPLALVRLIIVCLFGSVLGSPFKLYSSSSATRPTSPLRDTGRDGVRLGLATSGARCIPDLHPSRAARLCVMARSRSSSLGSFCWTIVLASSRAPRALTSFPKNLCRASCSVLSLNLRSFKGNERGSSSSSTMSIAPS